jgi:hypothetical protein
MRTEIAYLERLFYRELAKVGKEHCRIAPGGGRLSTAHLPYFSRRGKGHSELTMWPVSFIDGSPREHPTKLGEWFAHVNAVRA